MTRQEAITLLVGNANICAGATESFILAGINNVPSMDELVRELECHRHKAKQDEKSEAVALLFPRGNFNGYATAAAHMEGKFAEYDAARNAQRKMWEQSYGEFCAAYVAKRSQLAVEVA